MTAAPPHTRVQWIPFSYSFGCEKLALVLARPPTHLTPSAALPLDPPRVHESEVLPAYDAVELLLASLAFGTIYYRGSNS